jgi:hypothetical protein
LDNLPKAREAGGRGTTHVSADRAARDKAKLRVIVKNLSGVGRKRLARAQDAGWP